MFGAFPDRFAFADASRLLERKSLIPADLKPINFS